MAGYYRTTVVEITIMSGIDITVWGDTLNGRLICE